MSAYPPLRAPLVASSEAIELNAPEFCASPSPEPRWDARCAPRFTAQASGPQTPSQQVYPPDATSIDDETGKAYLAAAGWVLDEQQIEQNLPATTIADIRSGRVVKARGNDGRTYELDRSRPGNHIIGVDPNWLPTGHRWLRLPKDPSEYFVMHVLLSENEPDSVVRDFIDAPAAQVRSAVAELAKAKQILRSRASDPELQAAVRKLEAKARLEIRSKKALREQFFVMRNQHFHTDVAEDTAAKILEQHNIDPRPFRRKVKYACTPEQVFSILNQLLNPERDNGPAQLASEPKSDLESPT